MKRIYPLLLSLALCLPAAAQTVTNGQQVLQYAATLAVDPTYTAGSVTLTGNAALTVPDGGYGGQTYSLTVTQGTGCPCAISWPANTVGQTALNAPLNTGKPTYFLLRFDAPTSKWIVSMIGQAPAGFIAIYGSDGKPITSYSCTVVSGTSTITGTFSLTYTANPLWTTPASVYVESVSVQSGSGASSDPSKAFSAYWTSVSTTAVSGYVKSGTTLGILGATIVVGNVAEPITAKICGW